MYSALLAIILAVAMFLPSITTVTDHPVQIPVMPKEVQPLTTPTPTNTPTPDTNAAKIGELKKEIQSVQVNIEGNQKFLDFWKPDDPRRDYINGVINGFQVKLADLERQLAELTS